MYACALKIYVDHSLGTDGLFAARMDVFTLVSRPESTFATNTEKKKTHTHTRKLCTPFFCAFPPRARGDTCTISLAISTCNRPEFRHCCPDRGCSWVGRAFQGRMETSPHDRSLQLERRGAGDARKHGVGRGKRRGEKAVTNKMGARIYRTEGFSEPLYLRNSILL